jgi:hypothetical protein
MADSFEEHQSVSDWLALSTDQLLVVYGKQRCDANHSSLQPVSKERAESDFQPEMDEIALIQPERLAMSMASQLDSPLHHIKGESAKATASHLF